LIPVADKKTKAAKVQGQERAIFKLFSVGVVTARDDWVYGSNKSEVAKKAAFLVDEFNRARDSGASRDDIHALTAKSIKWTRHLLNLLEARRELTFDSDEVHTSQFRPFTRREIYFSPAFNEFQYQLPRVFMGTTPNPTIGFLSVSSNNRIATLAVEERFDIGFLKRGNGSTQSLPRHRYTPTGERIDNITDWALNRFTRHYGKRAGVSKDAIFHYVYACLHDPVWRDTYAINLRREFPRVPFHDDFAAWAEWGRQLMDLHINYETVAPWPVERHDTPDKKSRAAGLSPKVRLKSHPAEGRIEIDSETTLTGLPPRAWDYRLGNRSGLDWVLDQHKEKKVRDATVEAWLQDNPDCRYRFADHKERVIDLLARVARVSVDTLDIMDAMRVAPRSWLQATDEDT
jgi:predicted helicase